MKNTLIILVVATLTLAFYSQGVIPPKNLLVIVGLVLGAAMILLAFFRDPKKIDFDECRKNKAFKGLTDEQIIAKSKKIILGTGVVFILFSLYRLL